MSMSTGMQTNRMAPQASTADLSNGIVRTYWEHSPCGASRKLTGDVPELSREWLEQIEEYRYSVEPYIHSVARFTRYSGKKMLEIGVGAGTDHLQWARAGAECFSDVIWNNVESKGTKAYTIRELRTLFSEFRQFSAQPILTIYDTRLLPKALCKFLPDDWGWLQSGHRLNPTVGHMLCIDLPRGCEQAA